MTPSRFVPFAAPEHQPFSLGRSDRVAILELDLDRFLAQAPKPAQWKPVSRQPSSDLDLAFVLSEDVPAERLDNRLVQRLQHRARGLAGTDRAPCDGAGLDAHQGRPDAVAGHIPDEDEECPVGRLDIAEPVAAQL